MGDYDIEFDGEKKVSTTPVTYSDKPATEMMEHAPVTLTEEDVCCL